MLKRNISIKPKRKEKGQSTVEYIILVAAVLAALIFFLQPNGLFSTSVNDTLVSGTDGMVNMADRLSGSRPVN